MFVVVGANGFLGSYILRSILENTDEQVIATTRHIPDPDGQNERIQWQYCDVQSEKSVDALLEGLKAERSVSVVYLAAYHHPEEVQANPSLAWDINVTALSRFANKAGFVDRFYYVSTDSVYGDSVDHYHFREDDPLRPVNFYGHCKCAAEAITVHLERNVVRLPFLISPSLAGKKHFYDKIVDTARQGKRVEMFSDSFRSTLGFDQAAKLIVALIQSGQKNPVVNICGDEELSKYDVGLMIAKREHLDPNLIIPVLSEASEEWNQVQRAHSTLMDNTLLKTILDIDRIRLFEEISIS